MSAYSVNIAQAARMLGISAETVRVWQKKNLIPVVFREGGKPEVPAEYINRLTEFSHGSPAAADAELCTLEWSYRYGDEVVRSLTAQKIRKLHREEVLCTTAEFARMLGLAWRTVKTCWINTNEVSTISARGCNYLRRADAEQLAKEYRKTLDEFTVYEAAEQLQISPAYVQKLAREGVLVGENSLGGWRFQEDDVLNFLSRRQRDAASRSSAWTKSEVLKHIPEVTLRCCLRAGVIRFQMFGRTRYRYYNPDDVRRAEAFIQQLNPGFEWLAFAVGSSVRYSAQGAAARLGIAEPTALIWLNDELLPYTDLNPARLTGSPPRYRVIVGIYVDSLVRFSGSLPVRAYTAREYLRLCQAEKRLVPAKRPPR